MQSIDHIKNQRADEHRLNKMLNLVVIRISVIKLAGQKTQNHYREHKNIMPSPKSYIKKMIRRIKKNHYRDSGCRPQEKRRTLKKINRNKQNKSKQQQNKPLPLIIKMKFFHFHQNQKQLSYK